MLEVTPASCGQRGRHGAVARSQLWEGSFWGVVALTRITSVRDFGENVRENVR